MVDRGARLSAAPTQYLEWLSARDDGIWLGQSHGTAGVLHGLLTVNMVTMYFLSFFDRIVLIVTIYDNAQLPYSHPSSSYSFCTYPLL